MAMARLGARYASTGSTRDDSRFVGSCAPPICSAGLLVRKLVMVHVHFVVYFVADDQCTYA